MGRELYFEAAAPSLTHASRPAPHPRYGSRP
jgi:hypothetical protein